MVPAVAATILSLWSKSIILSSCVWKGFAHGMQSSKLRLCQASTVGNWVFRCGAALAIEMIDSGEDVPPEDEICDSDDEASQLQFASNAVKESVSLVSTKWEDPRRQQKAASMSQNVPSVQPVQSNQAQKIGFQALRWTGKGKPACVQWVFAFFACAPAPSNFQYQQVLRCLALPGWSGDGARLQRPLSESQHSPASYIQQIAHLTAVSRLYAARVAIWGFSPNNISDQKQMDENRKCKWRLNTTASHCDVPHFIRHIFPFHLTSTYLALLHPTISWHIKSPPPRLPSFHSMPYTHSCEATLDFTLRTPPT